MANEIFNRVRKSVPNHTRIFVKNSLDITEYIHKLLESKNMTQRDLAEKMKKSESEVSKYLSGGHNLTIRTLAKIQDALGEDIIVTADKVKATYSVLAEPKVEYNAKGDSKISIEK